MKYYLQLLGFLICFSSSAQTYSGSGGSIPDNSAPVNFYMTVSGLSSTTLNHTLGLVKVRININHTYDNDLIAKLIAPDGTVVSLFTNIGGGGHNFTNTCFDSSITSLPIASDTAPFTGTYLPEGNLGNVNNNQNGNGVWILQVQDNATADTGSVINWQLTFGSNAPLPFGMSSDIPLVVINTNGQTITGGSPVFANMKVIDHGIGATNHYLDTGNIFNGIIDIKVRGSYSASLPQVPYRITTYTADSSADSNVAMLNMPSEHDWILLAGYNDKSFIRNTLMYKLFGNIGHYASRTRHCEVILNGEYIGIYVFLEKIKRDKNRIDISKLKLSDTTGNELTGGYIFRHDYSDVGWTSQYAPDSCNTRYYEFEYDYPSPDSIQIPQGNYIKHIIDTLESRLYGSHPYDTLRGYRPKINTVSFVDYMLCNELAWNIDGYKKSMFFHKDKNSHDSTLHAGPIWDFDWSLKRMPWVPTDYSGWNYTLNPCDGDVLFLPWFNILMQDTLFQNEARCHWDYFRQHSFKTDSINHYIDSMAHLLRNAQQQHFTRWQILGINTGTPEVAPFSATFQEEIDTLKSILKQRMLWIDANLPGVCRKPYDPFPRLTTPSVVKEAGLNCYPNPASNSFTINYNGSPTRCIKVYSQLGQLLYTQNVTGSQFDISVDCAKWSPGLYLVVVERENNAPLLYKLMKE